MDWKPRASSPICRFRRPGLKDTGGALYIRAAMQFMRLPLKTDPRQVLRSSIELTNVICKVPGMIRFAPL